MRTAAPVVDVSAAAYTIPTDRSEADGTIAWEKTTLVIANVEAGGMQGLGYTYADAGNAKLIQEKLAEAITGKDAFDIPACLMAMQRSVRNIGWSGLAASAISAVDAALWDLKAKLLDLPLVALLGANREVVPVYGSGGFTTYSDAQLAEQLANWVEDGGCRWVKMKIGANPDRDPDRVQSARRAVGAAGLFVDANGALDRKQALHLAERFADFGVSWFEEPVSSDDLDGLRLLRDRAPSAIAIAAGEYSYTLDDVRHMLAAGAVDVQQVDASRCMGISGFIAAAALCDVHHIPLSGHCAPALHLHAACMVPGLQHLEWFHDHVRIERMLFDGAPELKAGAIRPDLSRAGLGLELKTEDAEQFMVS